MRFAAAWTPSWPVPPGFPSSRQASATRTPPDEWTTCSPGVPVPLAELDDLILTGLGVRAELAVPQEVADGACRLVRCSAADIADARTVVARYRDVSVGRTDASLVVLSRRHATVDLLTLDQRHFRTVPGAGDRLFRLLPAEA
jgi:uncharacterized protein